MSDEPTPDEIRAEALARIAVTLNMPNELLAGNCDERVHVTISDVFQDNNIPELHSDVTAARRQAIRRARYLDARYRAVQFGRLLIAQGGKEDLMGARLLALAYDLSLRDLGYPSTFDPRYRQRQRNRIKRNRR